MQNRLEIKEGYEKMDLIAIHDFLSKEAYWSKNIPFETVDSALKHSFCVGVFIDDAQVAFARLITDYAIFGYLADVYVLEAYRGQGIGKMLMQHIMAQEWVKKLRRYMLVTKDAQGLYAQYGFANPENPERIMEILNRNIYNTTNNTTLL